MNLIPALATGLLFGFGLVLSGMANPAKVQNFLDIFGTWDPSLAFVMGGAIAVTAPGFYLIKKRQNPIFKDSFAWPAKSDIDAQLLTGAAVFGIGWGLVGLCPGPAIVAFGSTLQGVPIFIAAMVLGLVCSKLIKLRWEHPAITN